MSENLKNQMKKDKFIGDLQKQSEELQKSQIQEYNQKLKELEAQKEKMLSSTLHHKSEEWEKERAILVLQNKQQNDQIKQMNQKHDEIIKHL